MQLGDQVLEIDPLAVLVSPSAQICMAERNNHLLATERGPRRGGISAPHLLCDWLNHFPFLGLSFLINMMTVCEE